MVDRQPSFLGSATRFDAIFGTVRSCGLIVTEEYTQLSQLSDILASIDPPIPAKILLSTFRDVLPDRLLKIYVDGGEGGDFAAAAADYDNKDATQQPMISKS